MSAERALPLEHTARETMSKLERLRRALVERREVVLIPFALGLTVAFLLFNPFTVVWIEVFERLALYRLFPLLFLGNALAWLGAGWCRHRRTGEPCFFPGAALGGAIAVFSSLLAVLTAWAVDWSPAWAGVAGLLLTSAELAVTVALLSYTELWRRIGWVHRVVAFGVRRAVTSGRFERYLDAKPHWGSPHSLVLLEGAFREAKARLAAGLTRGVREGDLETALGCARLLLRYLEEPAWSPRAPMKPPERARRAATLRREVAVLAAWLEAEGGRGRPPLEPHAPLQDDEAAIWQRVLSLPQREIPTAEACREVVNALLQGTGTLDPGEREAIAIAWLALGPASSLPAQLCLDVWISLRLADGADTLVPEKRYAALEPTALWACRRLPGLYTAWRDRAPDGWQESLSQQTTAAERAVGRAAAAAPPPDRVRREAEAEARQTSSWPYALVARSPAVIALTCLLLAAGWLPTALALAAVSPGARSLAALSWTEWNTVDAVGDRPPQQRAASLPVGAFASSGDWLLLGGAEGSHLFQVESRVARRVTRGAVQAITAGLGRGRFFLLAGDGGIHGIEAARWPRAELLLPPPEEPIWPGALPVAPAQILAQELDDRGWLLAIEGRGVARYRFVTDSSGRTLRSRSWQLGNASSLPLQDARITARGVWLLTQSGQLLLVDSDDLREVAGTRLTLPVASFDADPAGGWASALSADGALWLYRDDAWRGPFLGVSGGGVALESARQIGAARLAGRLAWLGTTGGIFAYDLDRRRLSTPSSRNAVHQIEPLGACTEASPESCQAVAATDGGLLLAALRRRDGSLTLSTLAEPAVASLSLAEDRQLLTYRWTSPKDGRSEWRALGAPLADSAPLTLAASSGWRQLEAAPDILAVMPLGGGQEHLFATRHGSFIYDPRLRHYQDASTSLWQTSVGQGNAETVERPLGIIEQLDFEQNVVAIVSGNPQVFSPELSKWRSLDPSPRGRARQIADAGERVYWVDEEAQLWTSRSAGPSADLLLSAGTAVLTPPSGELLGDLWQDQRGGNDWRLAFVHDGQLVTYDAARSQMVSTPLPAEGSEIRQVRLLAEGELLLTTTGIALGRHREIALAFGDRGAPFQPQLATAMARGGHDAEILLASPAGNIVRYDARWGRWDTIAAGTVPGDDPHRPIVRLISCRLGIVAQRRGDAPYLLQGGLWRELAAESSRTRVEAECGVLAPAPWPTQIQVGDWVFEQRPESRTLEIFDRDFPERHRRTVARDGRYRFADDVVEWIEHEPGTGAVLLRSSDGWWRFDPENGRRAQRVAKIPEAVPMRLKTPVLEVHAAAGRLALLPFDGPRAAVFDGGRMFFDRADGVVARRGSLFVLAGRRAIIRRSVADPHQIEDVWPLPAALSRAEGLTVERAVDGLHLRGRPGPDQPVLAFEHPAEGDGWIPGRRLEGPVRRCGAITWRRAAEPGSPFLPYPTGTGLKGPDRWWSGDRFSWDEIRDVVAMPGQRALLVSAAGVELRSLDPTADMELRPWQGLFRAVRAQRGSVASSILLLGGEGAPEAHLASGSRSLADLRRSPGPDLEESEPYLRLQREVGGIAWREVWRPPGPGPALEVAPGLPFDLDSLVADGRFVFDLPATAAATGGSWWIAGTCPVGTPCLLSSNVVAGATADAGERLELRGLESVPCPFRALRPGRGRDLVGLCRRHGGPERTFRGSGSAPTRRFETIALAEVSDLFRSGDHVHFSAEGIRWAAIGPRPLFEPPAFTLEPPSYPLFVVHRSGLALSPDVLVGLAIDSVDATLVAASRGGAYRWPLFTGAARPLELDAEHFVWRVEGAGGRSEVLTDMGPLVSCGATGLWTRFAGGERAARLRPGNESWLEQSLGSYQAACDVSTVVDDRQRWRVHRDGLSRGERAFPTSLDAWGWGRRAIGQPVGFAFDVRRRKLWVASSPGGLFKVDADDGQ